MATHHTTQKYLFAKQYMQIKWNSSEEIYAHTNGSEKK